MLKLLGALRHEPSRLGSRSPNWYIGGHQLMSVMPKSTNMTQVKETKSIEIESSTPSPLEPETKNPKKINSISEFQMKNKRNINHWPVSEKFEKIQSLFRIAESDNINKDHAIAAISTLHQWVHSGFIKMKDLEKDPKYCKLLRIVNPKLTQEMNVSTLPTRFNPVKSPSYLEYLHLNESYEIYATIPPTTAIKILSNLALKQQRITPLLSILTENINKSAETFSVKDIADILYSMATLKYSHPNLLMKLCGNLEKTVNSLNQSSVIRSILTSLGILRYRNTNVLNLLTEWIIKNEKILKTQDLHALLMTLGTLGYNPPNADIFFKESISKLNETDMVRSSDWVDFVWSLTILNRVTPAQLESVLSGKFLKNFAVLNDGPSSKNFKLLNINAAAKFLMKNYSGPFLPEDSPLLKIPITKSKDKQQFVASIIDALTSLLPSKNHFAVDINLGTGFLLDAELHVDEKFSPLLISGDKKDKKALKIAIVANYYHDYCQGESVLLGPIFLHYQLLEAWGYRILDISYQDFHPNDKLLQRITYINSRLKSIVK